MRTTLELLRIIIMFVLIGGLGWLLIENIYTINEATESYSWLGAIAILLLLFVWYRNKLQFTGWYKGKGRVKLPKPISLALVVSSLLLMGLPFILGSLG
jgi:hypothetical protein